jgi:hypothetical protein
LALQPFGSVGRILQIEEILQVPPGKIVFHVGCSSDLSLTMRPIVHAVSLAVLSDYLRAAVEGYGFPNKSGFIAAV